MQLLCCEQDTQCAVPRLSDTVYDFTLFSLWQPRIISAYTQNPHKTYISISHQKEQLNNHPVPKQPLSLIYMTMHLKCQSIAIQESSLGFVED